MGRAQRTQAATATALPRGGTLGVAAEAALARALRDIADGHLQVRRSEDGRDSPDRLVAGAPACWWAVLAARGQYFPPAQAGPWHLAGPPPR